MQRSHPSSRRKRAVRLLIGFHLNMLLAAQEHLGPRASLPSVGGLAACDRLFRRTLPARERDGDRTVAIP